MDHAALPSSPPRGLLAALFAGVFMAALDTAVIAPALPTLRALFALDHRASSWVMTVFVLCSLCSTALMANLGDRHGRRPVFLGCVGLFAAGSLIIALAPNFAVLLLGRAVQGIGGGGIIPTASAVIGDSLDATRRGRALGLLGAVYGMAFVFGPPLAALLMLFAGWQWIFVANLPLAAGILFLGGRTLPRKTTVGSSSRLDQQGILLVALVLVLWVLGITRLAGDSSWPWLLAGSVPALALLIRRECAVEALGGRPMVPMSLFARPRLRLAYALTVGAGFGMGSIVYLTAMATQAHRVDLAHGGFALLPMVLASMLGSVGSSRVLERTGTRWVVVSGFALMALGYAAVGWVSLGLPGFLLATVPVGLGVGVAVGGALRSVALDEAPLDFRGAAQGLVNMFTSIGTLMSASSVAALADFAGGGIQGLSLAFDAVAFFMLAMTIGALWLGERTTAREFAGAS